MSRANLVRIRAQLDDKVTAGLRGIRGEFDRLGSSKGARAILQGVGMGAGISAWGLVGSAIGAVTGKLGESKDAYIAEEASIAGLTTSLRANVRGWDGNTSAIENVLQARMKLGFSDDEQRSSLQLLVGATGDVTRALEVQRVAMDLARYKRISLAEASEALTKVEAGSYRILKTLGITLAEGATQTEALAAVQAVASGQAASFADTIEGRLTVAAVKQSEALERAGKHTARLGLIWDEFWAGAATGIGEYLDEQDRLAEALRRLGPGWHTQAEVDAVARSLGTTTFEYEKQVLTLGKLKPAVIGVTDAWRKLLPPTNAQAVASTLQAIEQAAEDAKGDVDALTRSLVDELFGEAERAGQRQEIKDRIAELQRELAKTTDKGDARILRGQLAGLRGELFELDLAIAQAKGPEAAIAFLDTWATKTGELTDEQTTLLAELRKVYAAGLKLSGLQLARITDGRYEGKLIPEERHSGGPVTAGTPYIVRPDEEVFTPTRDGYVSPIAGGSRSAPVVLPIVIDGREIARVVDERIYLQLAGAAGARR